MCWKVGIPLVNGSFRQPVFWEHFGFVLVLPLIFVLPFVLFGVVNARSDGPCGCRSRRILRGGVGRSCGAG